MHNESSLARAGQGRAEPSVLYKICKQFRAGTGVGRNVAGLALGNAFAHDLHTLYVASGISSLPAGKSISSYGHDTASSSSAQPQLPQA